MDRSLNTLRDPNKHPPIPLSIYMQSYWTELWYQLGKYYLFPLKFFSLCVNNHKSKYAVLLIHGYGRSKTDWNWMRKQLKGLPIFLVNLKPNFAPIEDITRNSIPKAIDTIRKKTNCEKIILIAHSMGGLVASYYSEHLDTDNLIEHIITIASPFHGTKISIMGFGENANQMCPGSNFTTELRHRIHYSTKNYYQIATRFENLLFPWDSALLPDTPAEHKFVVKFVPHLSLLHDESVSDKLNVWLADIQTQ